MDLTHREDVAYPACERGGDERSCSGSGGDVACQSLHLIFGSDSLEPKGDDSSVKRVYAQVDEQTCDSP